MHHRTPLSIMASGPVQVMTCVDYFGLRMIYLSMHHFKLVIPPRDGHLPRQCRSLWVPVSVFPKVDRSCFRLMAAHSSNKILMRCPDLFIDLLLTIALSQVYEQLRSRYP